MTNLTNDQVHNAVLHWIEAKTGVEVIKAHQGGDTPALPYIMVNMTGAVEVRQHHADIEYTDTGTPNSEGENIITAAPVIEMEWRFSVHSYGTAPTDRLRPILSAMKLQQPMETQLGIQGLHVHEASQIRNLPDWINNAWQPRGQIDLFVRGIIRDSVGTTDVIDEYSFDIAPMSAE